MGQEGVVSRGHGSSLDRHKFTLQKIRTAAGDYLAWFVCFVRSRSIMKREGFVSRVLGSSFTTILLRGKP